MKLSRFPIKLLIVGWLLLGQVAVFAQNNALVFQTDFGLKDGAVSAMKGVSFGVSPNLRLFDLTHEIPAYNIWEAAYRLEQTIRYWPAGTVFVSVVDPGVGSERKSVVAKTTSGHFIVTPDNGTLTLIAEHIGIDSIRQIDEKRNRLPGSAESYTFHGRDVYAYTGARLASSTISFAEVGPLLENKVISIPYQKATLEKGLLKGNIPVLDVQYGNVWTNIPMSMLQEAGIRYGDTVQVSILHNNKQVYKGRVLYGTSFSSVKPCKPVAYINSLLNFSVAINEGNFADFYKIASGQNWSLSIRK